MPPQRHRPRQGRLSVLLVPWTLVVPVLALVSAKAPAEVTQQELAQIVKKGLQDNSVLFDPPRVSAANGVLSYSPGGVFYPAYKSKPTQPLGFPIDVQFTIELLRKFRAAEKAELAFLEPYLVRMASVAKDELALIAKHKGSQEQLLKQLSGRDDQARAILKEGLQAWAKKQGLRLDTQSFAVGLMATVTVKTAPPGATVYYLNVVDYAVSKAAGVVDQMDQWHQATGDKIDLGGVYYFRATWPGGKSKQTAKIDVKKDLTLSLQAD